MRMYISGMFLQLRSSLEVGITYSATTPALHVASNVTNKKPTTVEWLVTTLTAVVDGLNHFLVGEQVSTEVAGLVEGFLTDRANVRSQIVVCVQMLFQFVPRDN